MTQEEFKEKLFKEWLINSLAIGATSLGLNSDKMKNIMVELLSHDLVWDHFDQVIENVKDFADKQAHQLLNEDE